LGATAGGLAQFIAQSTDLLKVRLQTAPEKYKSITFAAKTVYREEGLRGFYRGVGPNCGRAILVNLGDLGTKLEIKKKKKDRKKSNSEIFLMLLLLLFKIATYDIAKQYIVQTTNLGDNPATHALASIASGFFSTICSTPADVLKTRMMKGGLFVCISEMKLIF